MAHRRRRAGFLRALGGCAGVVETCPDDAELAAYLDRSLADVRARSLERHFDGCTVCRELAFLLAALSGDLASDEAPG